MEFNELVRRYEYVWHVTYAGAWPSIHEYGFCPAADLLRQSGRSDQVGVFRPACVSVAIDDGANATIRDQVRSRRDVGASVDGFDEADWWTLINARVYFFAREEHAIELRDKYLARGEPQDVIKIRTRALEESVAALEVATVNAGVFPRLVGKTRGAGTFIGLPDFDKANGLRIREITIRGRLPIEEKNVISVVRHDATTSPRRVFP
jgi:hypothetical protein